MHRYYTVKKYRTKNIQLLRQRHFPIRIKMPHCNYHLQSLSNMKQMKLSRKVNFGLCKTIFKSNFPITTNHLICMNMKMKQSYQMETGE